MPLPRGRRGPGAARRHLRRFAKSRGYAEDQNLDDAALMVSELVTNAVAHGLGRPILRMRDLDGAVWVAVQDRGHGFQPALTGRRAPNGRRDSSSETKSSDQVGDWGLPIVEALSEEWGVIAGPPTRVWFAKRLSIGTDRSA